MGVADRAQEEQSSLAPRPFLAFHRLQYSKAMKAGLVSFLT